MSEYKCIACEYRFLSDDEVPYCSSCDNETLEEIKEDLIIIDKEKIESHHIHPKFMDNRKGVGECFLINKKIHDKLHGNIMNWIWECIKKEDKKKTIDYIIKKSKEFLKVK